MVPINKETISPREIQLRRPQWRGESSNPRGRRKYKCINPRLTESLSPRTRSVSPSHSNFVSDSDIHNCNIRFLLSESGTEVSLLWRLASRMGVVCKSDEDRIIQMFREIENRDSTLLRD